MANIFRTFPEILVEWLLGSGPNCQLPEEPEQEGDPHNIANGPIKQEMEMVSKCIEHANGPIKQEMEMVLKCIEHANENKKHYDQQANLGENMKYLSLLIGKVDIGRQQLLSDKFEFESQRKDHLFLCITTASDVKKYLVRFGMFLAALDCLVLDIYGAYTFYNEGRPYLCIISLALFLNSVFVGTVRNAFIGKEAYNLRKIFLSGQGLDAPAYRSQDVLDFWKWIYTLPGKYFKIILRTSLNTIEKEPPPSFAEMSPPPFRFSGTQYAAYEQKIIESAIPTNWLPFSTSNDTSTTPWPIPGIHILFKILYFLSPSIQLHNFYLKWSQNVHGSLQDDGTFSRNLKVRRLLYEASYLQFIKFQASEMTTTELLIENIPQFTLRMLPLTDALLRNGLLDEFEKTGWTGLFLLVCSIGGLAVAMCTSILTKMEFYFAIENIGFKFDEPKCTMPEYGVLRLLLCVSAHSLTIGSSLIMIALSCTSETMGPLPLLVILPISIYIFWRNSHIEFHGSFLSLTTALSSFTLESDYRSKLKMNVLLKHSLVKIMFFTVIVIMNSGVLYFDKTHGNNLFIVLGSIWSLYLVGTALQLLDRYLWKWEWGVDFSVYTGETQGVVVAN